VPHTKQVESAPGGRATSRGCTGPCSGSGGGPTSDGGSEEGGRSGLDTDGLSSAGGISEEGRGEDIDGEAGGTIAREGSGEVEGGSAEGNEGAVTPEFSGGDDSGGAPTGREESGEAGRCGGRFDESVTGAGTRGAGRAPFGRSSAPYTWTSSSATSCFGSGAGASFDSSEVGGLSLSRRSRRRNDIGAG
jgi:hypothetical protein